MGNRQSYMVEVEDDDEDVDDVVLSPLMIQEKSDLLAINMNHITTTNYFVKLFL